MDEAEEQLYLIAIQMYRAAPGRSEAMNWVTRERPTIDRVACLWLISRFIELRPHRGR
jgi:Chromate resistance exported protein